jgi:diadenosine tetraphosphate (Ap4A) HIT family hydrolase
MLQNRRPLLFLLLEQKQRRGDHAYRLATVTGYNNVGINDGGRDAGQTMIMHCHIHHLIPRRKGDVADPPRGRIRYVIFLARDSISGPFLRAY